MADTRPRTKIETIGGMSVRKELDMRLDAARAEARAAAFVEAVSFLNGSGFAEAASALNQAAFGTQEHEEP